MINRRSIIIPPKSPPHPIPTSASFLIPLFSHPSVDKHFLNSPLQRPQLLGNSHSLPTPEPFWPGVNNKHIFSGNRYSHRRELTPFFFFMGRVVKCSKVLSPQHGRSVIAENQMAGLIIHFKASCRPITGALWALIPSFAFIWIFPK